MGNKFSPGYTTDLRGYAIRILQGQVLYFNSEGVLKRCSIEDGFMMKLHDLYRKSITSPAVLKRSSIGSGYNNKNAFKSAAAKMHEGKTIRDFCSEAVAECKRQSTKPHKDSRPKNSQKLVLDVHLPNVYRKKKHIRVTIQFDLNPNFKGGNSIYEAMRKIEYLTDEAQKRLYLVEELKDTPLSDLPRPSGIRLTPEELVVEFKVQA